MAEEYKNELEVLVCKEEMLKNGICLFTNRLCERYPNCYYKITEEEYNDFRSGEIKHCPICSNEIIIHITKKNYVIFKCDNCKTSTYPNRKIKTNIYLKP